MAVCPHSAPDSLAPSHSKAPVPAEAAALDALDVATRVVEEATVEASTADVIADVAAEVTTDAAADVVAEVIATLVSAVVAGAVVSVMASAVVVGVTTAVFADVETERTTPELVGMIAVVEERARVAVFLVYVRAVRVTRAEAATLELMGEKVAVCCPRPALDDKVLVKSSASQSSNSSRSAMGAASASAVKPAARKEVEKRMASRRKIKQERI